MKKTLSILLALVLMLSVGFSLPVSAKAETTALPASGQLDFSKSSVKKGEFKYEFKTIDHVEYCRKVYSDGYSTAYTVGVLFDTLEYAKTATEIKIVGEIDGIPVTEAGIEYCKNSTDKPIYDCYNTKVSENTEDLEKRYVCYNAYDSDTGEIEKQIGANVEKVTVPASIKFIPAETFSYMKKLKTVSLPKSLEKLGEGAFMNCTSLESVIFKGDKLTEIADRTFKNCKSLKTVRFNNNKIKSIGNYAFSNCKALKKINLPSSLRTLGGCAFEKSGLESVTIPKYASAPAYFNEDEMGDTFRNCKSLKTVTFLGKNVFIPSGAFWGCDSLKVINLKNATSVKFSRYDYVTVNAISTKNAVLRVNAKNAAVAKKLAEQMSKQSKTCKCKKIKIYVDGELKHNIPKETYSGKLPNVTASTALKVGSNNNNVARLKRFLNWAVGAGLKVNTKFDTSTKKAVMKFQKQTGLKANGIFGTAELKKAKTFKK